MRFLLLLLCVSLSLFLLILLFFFTSTSTYKSHDDGIQLQTPSPHSHSHSQLILPNKYHAPKHLTGLHHSPSARSILSQPKPTTALIATLDGSMYMVDREASGSMKVIWSFSTGSPIYHSYKAPLNKDNGKENASAALISGFVECGEDWALYMHDKHFGKMRISESIAEYVARTPTFSDDGAVTLGSKRTTLFEVNAKTGRIIKIHAMSDFDNDTIPWSDDKQSVSNILHTQKKDLADPVKLNSPEVILKIFRTDYSLKSVGPGSGIVLWTMTVSEFEAVLLCQHTSFDAENEYASERDLNFAMPYPCQEIQQVFRLQKNFLLEPSITERIPGDSHKNDMLSRPTTDLMLPLQHDIDRFFNDHDGNLMLPAPVPDSLPSSQPKISIHDSNDNANVLPQPLIEYITPGEVYPNRINDRSRSSPYILILVILVGLLPFYIRAKNRVQDRNNESELKSLPAKRKKTRKSGKNNGIIGKKEKHLTSGEEDALTPKNTDGEALLYNQGDGRMIGKLFVSNKEIAKGSNGTIVFEGMYEEGRAVAVKRLVRAHHDVANKEIKNLILSDRHPNIVRWHGVEYDQDFVYLALERCTYSLDNLIVRCSLKARETETEKDNMLELWKANGYPSPLLLKLMRDIVSGIVHLHDLGIIHRDLKPQNVLIIEGKSLCAKLSDMGISKRLLEDMSSLAHNVTGGGSSGWQAPEQLVQGRQTRAVDLFSLGCVLFFCLTGGKHPFGDRLERDVNVVRNKKDLFLVEFIPEAEDLISRLLNPDPDLRPKAIEVLHHPFFWSSEMRLSFLRDTSDRVELEDRETDSNLLKALESSATVALGAKWNEKMESAFLNNIGRYRRYKFDSVRDLLRVMRNKLNHYRELPLEIQELVGPVPEGFNEYFASRFPKLLIEVYKVICLYCKEEEFFQRYFRNVE